MKVIIVGSGYVGLVTGACLAEMGNEVWCVDNDTVKIDRLNNGVIPIYEPGLEDMVVNNHQAERLHFTTSLPDAMKQANTIFIAVGTPPGEDGSADLQYVLAVAEEIGEHISEYTVLVNKSTVPIGTADRVKTAVENILKKRRVSVPFDVVSNPEFLKEGAAVDDFMRPDRIVVGTDSERAAEIMKELYSPFTRSHERILVMNVRDAEMTKYAANAILATKISFMNEIANLCDRMGVDVENVRLGIGSDNRIGYSFIYPGVGYGGSCFPKDVKALINIAKNVGYEPLVLGAVEARNEDQKHVLFRKITAHFGNDLGKHHFGLWGLAFKPGTDDMREAPSRVLLQALIRAGATITAYDPVAMDAAKAEFPDEWVSSGQLKFSENQYDALKDADAMILITEWKPFRHPDFELIGKQLKSPVIFDGRNLYDPRISESGFRYYGIGRGTSSN